MMLPDLSMPWNFFIVTVVLFAIITGRYMVIAGLFYGIFYLWFPQKWLQRKVSNRSYPRMQLFKEMAWSTCTAILFAIMGAATIWLWQKGYTKVYTNIHDYSIVWLPLSLLISLLLHETYYCWLHRWMYQPAVFAVIHKVHHNSNTTSPFTAFSFHPLESLLQALFLPLLILILPLNTYVILFQLIIMTMSSVINHLNIEIYPRRFNNNIIGKWFIGATHHALHHSQFKYNYGLYFTFWDKWKRTESPRYHELFEQKTEKKD